MPFINGRYHVNPSMGQALEAAREAESALLALQQQASRNSGDDNGAAADSADASDPANNAPIHHIEIDATELVPTSSGRATRGFVARIHRAPASASASSSTQAPAPETHAFVDHRDLVNFLRDSLASS